MQRIFYRGIIQTYTNLRANKHRTADQIVGEVQNTEEEDEEQLFDNELVVVNETFVVINHETNCD